MVLSLQLLLEAPPLSIGWLIRWDEWEGKGGGKGGENKESGSEEERGEEEMVFISSVGGGRLGRREDG